jgi:hypothetical protein
MGQHNHENLCYNSINSKYQTIADLVEYNESDKP